MSLQRSIEVCYDFELNTVCSQEVYHPTESNFVQDLLDIRDECPDESIRGVSLEQVLKIAKLPPWLLCSDDKAVIRLYILWYIKHCTSENVWPVVSVQSVHESVPHFWIHMSNRPIPRRSERVKKPVHRFTYEFN